MAKFGPHVSLVKKPEEIMKQLSRLDGITGLIVTRQGQLLYPSTLQPLIELPGNESKSLIETYSKIETKLP